MRTSKKILTSLFTFLITLSCGTVAMAQQIPMAPQQASTGNETISDEALTLFVQAAQEVQKIQQGAQQEMMEVIQSENLDVQTFNTIAKSQQNPSQAQKADVSEEEMAAFEAAAQQINKMNQEIQVEMQMAIQEIGLEVEEYKEIMMAYQQDPSIQERIDAIMQN